MQINLKEYSFFIKPGYTDMRKGSRSLALIVQNEMQMLPFEKSVFLFCGKNRRTLKASVWNANGWLELIKRLECGSSFKWPESEDEAITIEVSALLQMLKGNDIWRTFPVYTPQLVG